MEQRFFERKLFSRMALTALLTALVWSSPALAQDPDTPVIGEMPADTPAGQTANSVSPPCPYDTAMTNDCGNRHPVTLGIRTNLGPAQSEVEAIVRAHPLIRIGWPTEFEVTRALHNPDELVLIDMFNPPHVTAYDRDSYLAGPNNYDHTGIYWDGVAARAVSLGGSNKPGLADRFAASLNELIRIRALNLLSDDSSDGSQSFCMETFDRECPVEGASDIAHLQSGDEVRVGVRNEGEEPLYFYVLMAATKMPVRLIIGPEDIGGAMLAPGQLAERPGEIITLGTGRHQIFTIRSREPIDVRVFSEATRQTGVGPGCNSQLERILCSALSGANIAIPDANLLTFRDWQMSVDTFYFINESKPMAGGGQVAPPGFAPWQVQIFSTKTLSAAQIEKARLAGGAGSMIHLQQPFQRYHRCAGSLIAPNIVLTAAHCVAKGETLENGQVLTSREVRVGTQNLRQGGAVYRIEAVVVHDGYAPGGQKDDIALLRIAPKRAPVAQKTILLPSDVRGMRRVGVGSKIEVLGWGYTEVVVGGGFEESQGNAVGFTTDNLRIATMTPMDLAQCKKIDGYATIDKKICATTPSDRIEPGNAFSCRNDSGGPVIQRLNQAGQVVQVGVVSGGVGCGAEVNGVQNPSLFVDLQLFTKWIASAKRRLTTIGNEVVKHAEPQ